MKHPEIQRNSQQRAEEGKIKEKVKGSISKRGRKVGSKPNFQKGNTFD